MEVRAGGGGSSSGVASQSHQEVLGGDPFSIQRLWLELEESVPYLSAEELRRCQQGLQIAYGAHKGQKRKSGEPYIIHPVAVAQILGELKMDADSIVAGLLHDVVEDTDKVSFADIESIFGEGVRHIVEGETKVTKLREKSGAFGGKDDKKHVDMQQLFIAMTKEIRIIIVKLADRLHNMRTLEHMPPHKQKKIATETLTIFAPLANLLGLYNIQNELEDLSFRYSLPDEYRALSVRVKSLKMDQNAVVYEARQALQEALESDPFFNQITESFEVRMASRSLYNIHKKLKANALQLRDLQNIVQLHVIAKPKDDIGHTAADVAAGMVSAADRQVCYYLLGKVHALWAPIPGKFKDFVATPKGNNYQALHTSVIPLGSKDLFPLEIQIRTETMNALAERGYAAHRRLVAGAVGGGGPAVAEVAANGNGNGNHSRSAEAYAKEGLWQAGWLNAVKDWQKEFVGSVTAEEFVATVVGDFLPRPIFCFSADGTLVSLPKGATIVDFAYQLDVGREMLMAKVSLLLLLLLAFSILTFALLRSLQVNGVPTHPSHELKLAEVVEIVRHHGPPSQYILKRQSEYLTYAKSRSTRHKIMKFLKAESQVSSQVSLLLLAVVLSADLALLRSSLHFAGAARGQGERQEAAEGGQGLRQERGNGLGLGVDALPYGGGCLAHPKVSLLLLLLAVVLSADLALLRSSLRRCTDEVGLLASVASVISSSGVGIRTYSGSSNEYSSGKSPPPCSRSPF